MTSSPPKIEKIHSNQLCPTGDNHLKIETDDAVIYVCNPDNTLQSNDYSQGDDNKKGGAFFPRFGAPFNSFLPRFGRPNFGFGFPGISPFAPSFGFPGISPFGFGVPGVLPSFAPSFGFPGILPSFAPSFAAPFAAPFASPLAPAIVPPFAFPQVIL